MKYKTLVHKLVSQGHSLVKAKKELNPLKVSLTTKSFNELQEDMIVNHKDLNDLYKIKETEDPKVFTLAILESELTARIETT